MTKSIFGVMAVVVALALSTMALAMASTTMLDPFTQDELDNNWEASRRFPTGGVTSVTAYGRDDVAQLGIDSDVTAGGGFNRTEGIKTTGVQDFGSTVQVDLYLDPAWETNAVRAGLWVAGAEDGERIDLFGIIDFINTDTCEVCTSHPDNTPDEVFQGFRIWDSAIGWSEYLDTAFEYGTWVTLSITLDTDEGRYSYSIDGEEVGTAGAGDAEVIGEVFLNSYNYGNDSFEDLSTDSYAAHWHAGVEQLENGDVTSTIVKEWFDVDGTPVTEPEGIDWGINLYVGDDEEPSASLPGDDNTVTMDLLEDGAGARYGIQEEPAPKGWEAVSCEGLSSTDWVNEGTSDLLVAGGADSGAFSASQSGVHLVCNQQLPEDVPAHISIAFVKGWTGDEFEGSDDVTVTFLVDIDGDEVTLDDGATSNPVDAAADWSLISENVTGFPDDVCSYTMTTGSTTVDSDGHLLIAVMNEVECGVPEETPSVTPEEAPSVTPEETPTVTPEETPTVTLELETEEIREISPAEAVEARPDFTG